MIGVIILETIDESSTIRIVISSLLLLGMMCLLLDLILLKNKDTVTKSMIICCIFCLIGCCGMWKASVHPKPSYKVLVEPDASVVEFYQTYNILSQDCEIFIVEEKD